MTPVKIYPCPRLLLSPQVTSLQFLLSVRIHSVRQESPQTAETKLLQQGITFPTPCESEWQAVSQHSASTHQHLHHFYPALHLSAMLYCLGDWAALPAPVTVTGSDNQPADSLSHVDCWPCLKSIMSNITPSIRLHCRWLIWDKPWRSRETQLCFWNNRGVCLALFQSVISVESASTEPGVY